MKSYHSQFPVRLKAILHKGIWAGSTQLIFSLIFFVVSAQLAVAASHPNMYINQKEIDAIKNKITANTQPWAGAYSTVISAAKSMLTKSPVSVTFQGKSSRQYFTEKPYCGWPDGCRDGQINPNADRGDYIAAIKLGDAVRDLGLAYAFTGEAQYAEKAIEFIRIWSVNPDTSMKPTTAAGNRIELFITLPGYLYGADLIWNYAGWNVDEKTTFRNWVQTLGNQAMSSGAGNNNFANWRVVLIAAAGALLDDSTLLDFAAMEWKRLLPLQMNGEGSATAGIMGQEQGRSKGLHYSLYAINAMIQGAEILRHRNVDLYRYKDNKGRGLELALDFITPYAINPAAWTAAGYPQITTITQDDSMALYELAYSHYKKPLYLDAINRWTRPLDDIRVMGINTLTHANLFDLDSTPLLTVAPRITTQPSSQTVDEGATATFSVTASDSATLNFQWFRNGSAISGATNARYTVERVSSADNGAVYRCEISNSAGRVVSNDAILTVQMDITAPTIDAGMVRDSDQVDILFSEVVTATSAEITGNYQITPDIAVLSATLTDEGRTVQLQVSDLADGVNYTITVNGIQDRASTANEIAPGSNISLVYEPGEGFENGIIPVGWSPLVASRWSMVMDEGDNALHLNTTSYSPLTGERPGEIILLPNTYEDFTFGVQAKLDEPVSNANADYVLVFGYQDKNNYYYMMFNDAQNNTQLFRVVDGSREELNTASSDWVTDAAYHTVEISRQGNWIEVRFDNAVILQTTDSTFGAGQLGLGSYNDSAYFDNVRVVGTANVIPSMVDGTPPSIPINVTTTLVGINTINLNWNAAEDVESGITSYKIYRDDILQEAVDGTSYSDNGLQASTTYRYTIAAVNGADLESSKSAELIVSTDSNDTTPVADSGGAGAVGWFDILLALFGVSMLVVRYRLKDTVLSETISS